MDDRGDGTKLRENTSAYSRFINQYFSSKMSAVKTKYISSLKDLILYEDDHIILVNKPLNMASLDDKHARNLIGLAKKYQEDIQLCHRLDKNTSGVLLMAKDPDTYRTMALQFQHRQVSKKYLALVTGIHNFKDEKVDLPLLITSNKRVSVNKSEGKKAETLVNSIESFRNFTLLECEPVTGRMHQIRVHLKALGCPIVGDSLYGGIDVYLSKLKRNYKSSNKREEQSLNHGYLLHAQSLEFTHPASEEVVKFSAPLPKNFEVVLKVLRKYNSK